MALKRKQSRFSSDINTELPQVESVYTLSTEIVNQGTGDTALMTTIDYAYVINFVNNQGFAIMSAVDGLPDMLAYFESGNYDDSPSNGTAIRNPGIGIFLHCLTEWASLNIKDDSGDYAGNQLTYDTIYSEAMSGNGIQTKWGQDVPYDMYTAVIDGEHAPTGCVATATAQIMSFFEYPVSFKGRTYDWGAMKTVHKYSYTNSPAEMVAYLMNLIGGKDYLDMEYGKNSSGAYPKYVLRTLRKLGYASKGTHITYSTVKAIEEIASGYPIMVCGHTSKNKSGHAWVADAYSQRIITLYVNGKKQRTDTEQYLRCNWGWDGLYDGWVLAGVFDPTTATVNPPIRPENTGLNSHNPTIDFEEDEIVDSQGWRCGGELLDNGIPINAFNKNMSMIIGIRANIVLNKF